MPPLVWKALPWAVVAVAITVAVQMYGAKREAQGAVRAHIETANVERERYVADSSANVKARKEAADSIVQLKRTIAQATVQQRAAAHKADSATAALRQTLTAEQTTQLDAITAAHVRERTAWGQKEMAYLARIQLMVADSTRMENAAQSLQRENESLRRATEVASLGHGASFVQRVSPYIAAAVVVAYGVDKFMPRR